MIVFGQYLPAKEKMVVLLIGVAGLIYTIGYITAQQPLLALVIALVIPALLAILFLPDICTLFVLFMMYSNLSTVATQFHQVPFVIGISVPLLLAIPIAHYLIIQRQSLIITPVMCLVLLFYVVQIIGTALSRDVPQATENLIRYLSEGLLLYTLVFNAVRSWVTMRKILWVLLLAGAILGGFGLHQMLNGAYDNNYWGLAQVSNAAFSTGEETLYGEVMQPRLAGSIGEQNRFAQTMLMLVPLGVFLVQSERNWLARGAVAILTIFTMIAVVGTFSRGAALGFMGMLLTMVLMRYIKVRWFVTILLSALLLLVLFPQYGDRVLRLQGLMGLVAEQENITVENKPDGSLQGRANEALTAALVFADYPVFGVGPQMFPTFYQEYSKEVGYKRTDGQERQAHNLYLGIAADNGLVGLTCFLAIIGLTLHSLVKVRRQWLLRRSELAHTATAFILAIIIYLITGIGAHFTYIRFFWIIMALANSVCYIAQVESLNQRQWTYRSHNV